MVLRLVLLLCLAASGAQAQGTAAAERIIAAFETWLETNETTGSIAVLRHGAPVATAGFGKEASAPVELASVGKAITAVCVDELVRDGRLSYDDTLSLLMGTGPDLRIADLVVHTSGLRKDSTQRAMQLWLDRSGHRAMNVLEKVIDRGTPKGAVGAYHYNNENYAVLGALIEHVTGESYETVCHDRAVAPAGVTATPSPRAGAFLSWGGWQMNVADFARWHQHWFGRDGRIGAAPLDLPHVELAKDVYHGPGSFVRISPQGANFWYFGALCFPLRLNVGSYAVTWGGVLTTVVAYDTCADWDAMGALDLALGRAALGG